MCSTSAADKLKAGKDTAQALKDFGLRISKLLVSVWGFVLKPSRLPT